MNNRAILLLVVFSLLLLIKYFRSDSFQKLLFRQIDRKRASAEENWKKMRAERQRWEEQNPYAPHWHTERQELLKRELGTYMLFVDRGPRFSQTILDHRARDLETLAAEIVDEDGIFQNQDDEE